MSKILLILLVIVITLCTAISVYVVYDVILLPAIIHTYYFIIENVLSRIKKYIEAKKELKLHKQTVKVTKEILENDKC